MAATAQPPIELAPAASVPFAVHCVCGQTRTGERLAQEQILTCASCGRRLFVLPVSPWPTTEQDLASWVDRLQKAKAAQPAVRSPRRRAWLPPLVAGGVTLVLVVVVFGVLWSYLRHDTGARHATQAREHAEAARTALQRGDLHAAHTALERARQDLSRAGGTASLAESQALRGLERQVELALTLLRPCLEELLIEARQMPVEKWESRFRDEYQGRGIVFDARVVQSPGEPHLDYRLEAADTLGRVAIEDLHRARERFSQRGSQRWIFGGKLASMRLEAAPDAPEGLWVVHFEPESFVLFTHKSILKALGLPEEPTWDELLRGQSSNQLYSVAEDTPQDVRREIGPPDRISRQVLAGRFVEQWAYDRNPPVWINLEIRPGLPPRLAPLGPARPR